MPTVPLWRKLGEGRVFEPQFCNKSSVVTRDGRRQQFAYMPRCLRRTQRDVAGPPARCIAAYRASHFQHRYIWLQLVIYSNLPPAATAAAVPRLFSAAAAFKSTSAPGQEEAALLVWRISCSPPSLKPDGAIFALLKGALATCSAALLQTEYCGILFLLGNHLPPNCRPTL